jgi:Na+-translocating ferredoxin:NAD+ oxidoreductase RnfG subunit
MKKLFAEKPLLHYTFVLAMVAFVCGLVIGGVNKITEPIIANNIYQAKLKAYKAVVSDLVSFEELVLNNDPLSIQSKVAVYDVLEPTEDTEPIAYIYESFQSNKFGQMRIVVSVDANGIILGAVFIEIVQTYKVEATKSNLEAYIGSSITPLTPVGDIEAGATGSLTTLRAMLADIATAHTQTLLSISAQNAFDKEVVFA